MLDEMLSEKQVAEMLGISPHTLACRRHRGKLPVYYKIGQRVRYKKADVLDFVEQTKQPVFEIVAQKEPFKFLKTKDLVGLLGVSNMTIHNWVKAGKFPKPIRFGARTYAWEQSVVTEYIKQGVKNVVSK